MVAPQAPDIAVSDLEDGTLTELFDGADLDRLRLRDLSGDEASLRGASIRETLLDQPALTTLRAGRGHWKDVRVHAGRIGVLEVYDSEWRSVELEGSRLAYVNLRGADVADLALRECHVDELDLGEASLRRVSLAGSRIGRLGLRGARLESFDLRGATVEAIDGVESLRGAVLSPMQLMDLAPLLADALGIVVEDSDT